MTEPSGTQALVLALCSAFVLGLLVGIMERGTMMSALRVLGYYIVMIPITVGFLVVGCAFFPVYVVGEAWRKRTWWRSDKQ